MKTVKHATVQKIASEVAGGKKGGRPRPPRFDRLMTGTRVCRRARTPLLIPNGDAVASQIRNDGVSLAVVFEVSCLYVDWLSSGGEMTR